MRIDVRPLVKELLENENLIVNYNELNNGGFDLSVRINEEEKACCEPEKGKQNWEQEIVICPHCGSNNIQYMYGTALVYTGNKNQFTCHYLCKDCHKEFDV